MVRETKETSEPREDPDLELVEQARRAPEGDLRAFEEIVDRYRSRVLANCRYLSRSSEDAEDLAQEVFVDVEDPAVEAAEQLHVEPAAEERVHSADERQRIGQVLDEIVDTLRIPLIMRDMDGLAYQEIADTLGIGLSAVTMRIKRGREEFRRLHDARDADGPGAVLMELLAMVFGFRATAAKDEGDPR